MPGLGGTCARALFEPGVWMYQGCLFLLFFLVFFLAHMVFESLAESLDDPE